MINRDLCNYAKNSWQGFAASITILSKSDSNGISLVESQKELINFDAIAKTLYPKDQCPASVDGLEITSSIVELVEFKSGFKKRITKDNFNKETAKCEYLGSLCNCYWNLFFKHQKSETKELITAIRFKAIESYLILEKRILPYCEELIPGNRTKVKLTIVIDANEIDDLENTLAELSDTLAEPNNCFTQITQALKRIHVQKDASGNEYFYDSIDVMSAQDYSNRIEKA